MDENVIQINQNTWRIEDGMVRFFLLAGTEKALLIDSGMTRRGVRALAEELAGLPVELVNTHGDPDHVGANDEFDRAYAHPAEEENYRRSGVKNQLVPVQEGDVLELGGRPVEILHLPGHTPGSIALLDVNARVVISGDSVQTGGIVMLGTSRSIGQLAGSLKKLADTWGGRFDAVWASHGSFPLPASFLPELQESVQRVLAGEGKLSPAEFFGHPVQRLRCGCGTFIVDP